MKKALVLLFMGVTLLFSGNLYAGDKTYSVKPQPGRPNPTPTPNKPGMPARVPVVVYLDEETGELTLLFNNTFSSAQIALSQNGLTIEDEELDAVAGQTLLYNLSTYSAGEYTLTIAAAGDIIAAYTISIEE